MTDEKPVTKRLVALACATSIMAFASQSHAGLEEAYASVFENSDTNGSELMSAPEYLHLQEELFLLVDYNEDNFLAAEEWNNWDPSFMGVEYDRAEIGKIFAIMARLFVTLDVDGDSRLTRDELTAGLFLAFADADVSSDGFLDTAEFANAYRLPAIVSRGLIDLFDVAPLRSESPATTN